MAPGVANRWAPLLRYSSVGSRLHLRRGQVIYGQGEPSGTLFFVERGRVRLTSVSPDGDQVTVALISPGMFFGESCLSSKAEHRATAGALTECVVWRLNRMEVELLVRQHEAFARCLIEFLAEQSRRYQEDLLDHLLNSSERRLARMLLLLAYSNRSLKQERTITGVSHETLAGLIGTTRARVTAFMTKFRKLGFVDYNRGEIRVRPAIGKLLDH
jgi:CRP/FNR family cyclic AMP-dependent transcriptional regulator